MTVTGRTLGANLEERPEPDEKFIRPLDRPFRDEPGLIIIRGNLAPDSAVVKLSAVPPEIRQFEGPASVFEEEDGAIKGLGTGAIKRGQVIVLRNMGPKGGPGTVFAAELHGALVGAGLSSGVAVVTDGDLSSLSSGITVGQVMPEAAEGGPLALVKDGDIIAIDLSQRQMDLKVDAPELEQRLKAWSPPALPTEYRWLSMYWQLVQPLSKGAVLGDRSRADPGSDTRKRARPKKPLLLQSSTILCRKLENRTSAMAKDNSFKRAIQSGRRQIGIWSNLSSTLSVEIVAGAGFHWVVLDAEHGPSELNEILSQLQAISSYPVEPVVRIPANEKIVIKKFMDIGVRTFLVPFVETVEEARSVVAYTRYPPHGVRGVSTANRANAFGRVKDYLKTAHERVCILAQIESQRGLDQLPASCRLTASTPPSSARRIWLPASFIWAIMATRMLRPP